MVFFFTSCKGVTAETGRQVPSSYHWETTGERWAHMNFQRYQKRNIIPKSIYLWLDPFYDHEKQFGNNFIQIQTQIINLIFEVFCFYMIFKYLNIFYYYIHT